jgi:hypothetical protein
VNGRDRRLWDHIPSAVSCCSPMLILRRPKIERDLSFEQSSLFDSNSSMNFRHEHVKRSSINDIVYWSSSVQRHELKRPRFAVKHKDQILEHCVICVCYLESEGEPWRLVHEQGMTILVVLRSVVPGCHEFQRQSAKRVTSKT